MTPIFLSYIIPCYNAEKYIAACLDSIFHQNIACVLYEIICINDCSEDKTVEVIKDYQMKNSALFLINLETKSTPGKARNKGLDVARGEYVWFIDADDTIKPNCIQQIYLNCLKYQPDELLFNFDITNQDRKIIQIDTTFQNTQLTNGINFINTYFPNKLSQLSIVWRQVYKTEFLRKSDLRFPDLQIGEDSIFAWQSLILAKKVKAIESVFYTYRVNSDSTTSQFKKQPNINSLFDQSILFGIKTLGIIKKNPHLNKDIVDCLIDNAYWGFNSISSILIYQYTIDQYKEFYALCRINHSDIQKIKDYLSSKNLRIIQLMRLGFIFWFSYIILEKIRYKYKHSGHHQLK